MSNKIKYNEINWPKSVTEIHTHLGGSVPLYRLWEIAIDRGIRGIGSGYEEFINMAKIQGDEVTDLDTYLEFYDRIELIQSGPAALRESVIIAIHRAYRTGGMPKAGPSGEGGHNEPLFKIGALELRFNPLKRTAALLSKGHTSGLYDVDRVIKAACDAIEEVEIAVKGKIRVGLLFCFGRDLPHEANMIIAEKLAIWATKTDKIVGIDLAGHESRDPLSDPKKLQAMKECFDLVPPKLGRTLHVGETEHVDLNTFVKTIEAINPHRIAHPIVAFRDWFARKDDRGLKLLQERKIPIEFCVKSNLLTRAVSDVTEYAKLIQTCDEFGLGYTFSTDAPSLQVTSLAEELILLLDSGAATPDQILRALRTADEVTFLHKRFE